MSGGEGVRGKNWRNAKELNFDAIITFKHNASDFISALLQSGKQVVFMKDIPSLDFDIDTCFDNRPLRITKPNLRNNCTIDYEEFKSKLEPYDLVIDDILEKFPTVETYDPRPLFCSVNTNKCLAADNSLPYYMDGDHLNRYGADMVIEDLIRKIAFKKTD